MCTRFQRKYLWIGDSLSWIFVLCTELSVFSLSKHPDRETFTRDTELLVIGPFAHVGFLAPIRGKVGERQALTRLSLVAATKHTKTIVILGLRAMFLASRWVHCLMPDYSGNLLKCHPIYSPIELLLSRIWNTLERKLAGEI